MKFYVTVEDLPKIKKSILNLKLFSIIYIPEILAEYGYTYETIDEYGSFIISKHIDDLIKYLKFRGVGQRFSNDAYKQIHIHINECYIACFIESIYSSASIEILWSILTFLNFTPISETFFYRP